MPYSIAIHYISTGEKVIDFKYKLLTFNSLPFHKLKTIPYPRATFKWVEHFDDSTLMAARVLLLLMLLNDRHVGNGHFCCEVAFRSLKLERSLHVQLIESNIECL